MVEQHHIFFLAEFDDKPVGFASVGKLEEGIFKLQKLYVQPELQGKGVGKAFSEKQLSMRQSNAAVMHPVECKQE
jgi:GNAT superfamily N-acetyltransferase